MTRPRVLVADDCKDTADSTALLIDLWGHKVQVAYDGEGALAAARAFQPDVLLLDIGMPKMDGCHLAQAIRQQAKEDCVLIALSR